MKEAEKYELKGEALYGKESGFRVIMDKELVEKVVDVIHKG
jgi:hypothetical protein